MALVALLLEVLQRPTMGDLMILTIPIWVAVILGVLVGWAWKPHWVDNFDVTDSVKCKIDQESAKGMLSSLLNLVGLNSLKMQLPSCISWIKDCTFERDLSGSSLNLSSDPLLSSLELQGEKSNLVTSDDLVYLNQLVEESDGGPAWIPMMDRSTSTMSYQAWRRDAETGPPQYRSRTVYEDATPEVLRDFFWDDEFRAEWDDMLIKAETLEENATTGTMMVQWVRKFPFFCSDREYIIGRRIWDAGRSYYCVTKGLPCSTVPRQKKPRRVDLYYSSWLIRAVESKKDSQKPACEVLLFHYEDMGIPWEIAKLGVRQGMWGAVKKIEPGLRAYQKHRASGASLSPCASMAQINAKVCKDRLRSLENASNEEVDTTINSTEKPLGRNISKFLVAGGAVALACTLDRGLVTKAVIFGVARRFANIGRRL
ncbi:hypothetical protein LIER_04398 [Lithospermum erythrorhizon]|uniref:START domain-containing protein n=1 Tax=Lithospermum erythrorhizon TaxID=34254 RepID=A0AAV3NWM1_LITER